MIADQTPSDAGIQNQSAWKNASESSATGAATAFAPRCWLMSDTLIVFSTKPLQVIVPAGSRLWAGDHELIV